MHQLRPLCSPKLCLLLFSLALPAFAQDATVLGSITDPTGAAIPNAAISVTSFDTGQIRQLKSNDLGQYLVPDLHIGKYTIRVAVSGFKAEEQKDIVLNVGDRARVDFKLQVGNISESVDVEAKAVAVQSESGEVSDVINGQQVSQLATNGRSVYSLATLTAGASS